MGGFAYGARRGRPVSGRGNVVVGKTPLIVAPLIVAGLVLFLAFYAGRWWERTGRRWASSQLDPGIYRDLVAYVQGLLSPTDFEDPPYLPGKLREEAVKLAARAADHDRKMMRAERRRRGY